MKITTLLPAFMAIVCLSACKKDDNKYNSNGNCPAADVITITTNSPVIVGWPLTLSTIEDMSNLYRWTGPNGWVVDYGVYSNTADEQYKPSTTFADSGTYKVELRDRDGCVARRGIVHVQIIDAPPAPCSVTNNTSTSSVIGVGGATYSNISAWGSGGIYTIEAHEPGGETLTIRFNGDAPPKPGIYKSSGAYFAIDDNKSGVFFSDFQDFVMKADYDIYVTNVGGHLVVGFCSAQLDNPVSSTPIIVSAKITLP